jgi:hypothetical protein
MRMTTLELSAARESPPMPNRSQSVALHTAPEWRWEGDGMYRLCVAITLFVLNSCIAQSQMSVAPHHHAPTPIIDGAVHPELIPDITAYRLWLVIVSRPPVPTDDEVKHQHIQLARVGLQIAEEHALVLILADFHTQYETLIQNYNATAKAVLASGQQPDIAAMRLQRDLLVQSAHDCGLFTILICSSAPRI